MKTPLLVRSTSLLCTLGVAITAAHAQPALTVYNQNFAVVRDSLPLDLKPGLNRVVVSNTTALLEPDSVVLRDPTGKRQLQIMEQFYRADPISQAFLLSLNEGKTIDFRVQRGDKTEMIQGKIIRSGYVPPSATTRNPYDGSYPNQAGLATQPIIEVEGQLRFSLPGEPVFPALPSDAILKPTLNWLLRADEGGPLQAEMAYVTSGMSWKADYNVIASDNKTGTSEPLDLTAWVTLTNNSGKTFENARIKLMAGDVNKVTSNSSVGATFAFRTQAESVPVRSIGEKSFDEYHLYTLNEATTLRDRETKQVEFARASGIKSSSSYTYDGVQLDANRYSGYGYESIRQDQNFGTTSNTKVLVMREFANTTANGLGIALPKGRLRFYRRDSDGQLEFIGENVIDHTPQGETVRVAMGNAFDIVGERKRVAYKIDNDQKYLDESFQITLRNRKKSAAEVRVVEHLYRGNNWSIPTKSNAFVKNDFNTIEFRVQIPPDSEKVVTYTVHYTW